MRLFPRALICALATALTIGTASAPTHAATSSADSRARLRLDTNLRGAVAAGSTASQRVIIRVKPGARAALRTALVAHGDQILAEHESPDAITASVHGGDLESLAGQDAVLSVSTDAVVRPHGLLS